MGLDTRYIECTERYGCKKGVPPGQRLYIGHKTSLFFANVVYILYTSNHYN